MRQNQDSYLPAEINLLVTFLRNRFDYLLSLFLNSVTSFFLAALNLDSPVFYQNLTMFSFVP